MTKALNQLTIAFGLLNGAQIRALDILDQRQFMRLAIAHLTDDRRHHMKLGKLRCTPAPLTGYQLVAILRTFLWPHQNGLHKSLGAD